MYLANETMSLFRFALRHTQNFPSSCCLTLNIWFILLYIYFNDLFVYCTFYIDVFLYFIDVTDVVTETLSQTEEFKSTSAEDHILDSALEKAKERFKISNMIACREAANHAKIVFIGYDTSCPINRVTETEFHGVRIIIKHPLQIDDLMPSLDMTQMTQKRCVSLEDECLINTSIKEHAEDLWRKHSNLTIISGDDVKICGGEQRKQPCVTLYCLSKGYIPIDEEPFPRKLGSAVVDVREGYFLLGTNTRRGEVNDRNDPLCMGSSIGHARKQSAGTLGLFVDIPATTESAVGFITCSHVLFDCVGRGTFTFIKDTVNPEKVTQPSTIEFCRWTDTVCGEIERAVFEPSFNPCSVDAALVKVTSRSPTSGHFVIRNKMQVLDSGNFLNITMLT